MDFSLDRALEILERTPATLQALLHGLPDEWTRATEGPQTWSAYDIVGHLIHGEKTDWLPRMAIILADGADKTFAPFDRQAQFADSAGKSLADLLAEFRALREDGLTRLRAAHLTAADLTRTGRHPVFGEVTLSQLLATWTVHDLNHLAQIARVMARQYHTAVGPWVEYLGILNR